MSTIFIISATRKISKVSQKNENFFHEVILFVENEYELKIEKITIERYRPNSTKY